MCLASAAAFYVALPSEPDRFLSPHSGAWRRQPADAVPPHLRGVLERLIEALETTHKDTLEPQVAHVANSVMQAYEVGAAARRVALEERGRCS